MKLLEQTNMKYFMKLGANQ
jgi:hypothetical protein